jgi:leucyl aminopeptidase
VVKVSASPISIEKLKNTVVLFATKDSTLGTQGKAFDKLYGGIVAKALKASRFTGAKESTYAFATPHLENVAHIIIAGLGSEKNINANTWRRTSIKAAQRAEALGSKEAQFVIENIKDDKTNADTIAVAVYEGVQLASYKFDRFKTGQKAHQKTSLQKVVVQMKDEKAFKKEITLLDAQTEGADLARDLVNLPPNIANPDLMAQTAKTLTKDGVKVKIIGEKEMEKLGLNLLLAVGRASTQESRLIVMKYNGDKKSKDYKCMVGKGVMFDTGGYNLKPGAGMAQMKADMAGSAAVMGAMKALAKRKANVNVIAVCGCVVNMVGGNGFLPSDILTSYSGKTVEIGNTDAEGRLVLADAMAYIIDKEKPTEIIDVATLTGACMVALGGHYGGLFSNCDTMSKGLLASGENTGERLWRLPIDSGYGAKPKLADLNNDGNPYGGASTAAVFLKQFVGDTPWAHLDIAGVGIGDKIPGTSPVAGASGFGARLLVNYFES